MAPRLANRSEKRKNATEREKARMVAISRDIDHIQSLVCPEMNQPTKSKVLRVAVDRLNYLENLFIKLQEMEAAGDHSVGNQSLGNESIGNQPVQTQPLQIQGRQRATQMIQNSSIGPSSPNSFDSSVDYYPVDYSNQGYPDESLDLDLSNPSNPNYSNQSIETIQIPPYQPLQSYEQPVQPNQHFWQEAQADQAAPEVQHESTTQFTDFLQLEDHGDTLQSQADNFFQQFENEIQNCL